jgi:prolyl oligopeptidase
MIRNRYALLALAAVMSWTSGVGAESYDWLEPATEPKALAWAREHTTRSTQALRSGSQYKPLLAELETVLEANAPISDIDLLGGKAIRLHRDAANPRGLLQVADRAADGAIGEWRTVLDVAALGKAEGRPLQLDWAYGSKCLAPKFERCLLALSDGGSDEVSMREFDLRAATFVKHGFSSPAGRTQVAWLSEDKVLIAHTAGNAPKTAAGWSASLRLWQRGQSLDAAPVVFTAPTTDATLQLFSIGASAHVYAVRVIDYSTFEVHSVDAQGRLTKLPLPAKLKPFAVQGGTDRHLIVQLGQPAHIAGRDLPAETVIAVDADPAVAETDRLQVVYAPAHGETIGATFGRAGTRQRIFLPIRKDLKLQLLAARYDSGRWRVEPILAAAAGTDITVIGADPSAEDFIIRKTSFLTPPRLELIRANSAAKTLEAAPAAFDASKYVVEIRSAASKDGVAIDYYVVKPVKPTAAGATPTLITGYGAFGITLDPAYLGRSFGGQALKLWFDRGGALVLPAIRGGGERGVAWHEAAIREKRQISYDDFIAVTEDLVRSGLTQPSRIGVFGTSNGGLLAATVAVQRPDLYGAAISDVPLTDMLRYPQIAMGAAWMNEYGDPADPTMRVALERYSPLHNIKEGVRYPPFLVTISTTDNRVGPAHARKLAARLEAVGAQVYFLEDEEGGHGVSDPLSRPDLMAMRMAFLIERLMR